MQSGFSSQFDATLLTISAFISSVSNGTNYALGTASETFADAELVHKMTSTAFKLLSPGSLPGFFFAASLLLRVFHYLLVNKMAKREVEKQYNQYTTKLD